MRAVVVGYVAGMTVKPTWEDRDLPVLRAIVELREETGDAVVSAQVAERSGFSDIDIEKAISALDGANPPFFEARMFAGGSYLITEVTERARRAVGLWPTPEDLADRLIANFNRAADEAQGEEKSKIREAAKALAGVGRSILIEVATKSIGA